MRPNIALIFALILVGVFSVPFLASSKRSTPAAFPLNPHAQSVSQTRVQIPPPIISKKHPIKAQSAEGALWRTDGGFQPVLMLKNMLEISPISVSPILFMADGTEYDLPEVQLDPAGVAMINVKTALQSAPAEIQRHLSLYGSAGIKFQWAWPAVFAAIRNSDDVRGLLYQTHLDSDAAYVHDPSIKQWEQIIESTWWKQDPNVAGYLTLTNTSLNSVAAAITVTDPGAKYAASQTLSIAPHTTQWLDLMTLWAQLPSSSIAGGIEISYSGAHNALSLTGGLEDSNKGYSHMLHFVESSQMAPDPNVVLPSSQSSSGGSTSQAAVPPQNTNFDSPGIMVGIQDADMQFPVGTKFVPYVVLRNTTGNPMQVQLTANTMSGSGGLDVPLGSIALDPHSTRQIDMSSLLGSVGLDSYNGYINLRTSFSGSPTDLLQESGSIDQTLNYVFEVPPRLEESSSGRTYNYWNTNGDTDTMFTLWNYSNDAEDLVLTFQHQEGKYEMPVHLEAHSSMTLSVGKLIHSQVPDRVGRVIPASIVQGSAKISGVNGPKDKIRVAVFAGIFNSRTGTCSYPCGPCNALQFVELSQDEFDLIVADSIFADAYAVYEDGTQVEVSNDSTWLSYNTSVATVNTGNTTGVSVGATSISADFLGTGPGSGTGRGYSCCGQQGCGTTDCSGSSDINVPATPYHVQLDLSESPNPNRTSDGHLIIYYAYFSTSGQLSDLAPCTIREYVTYPGSGSTYYWNSPPYVSGSHTSIPLIISIAADGFMGDNHGHADFSTPANDSFTVNQVYQFSCPNYQNGAWTQFYPTSGTQQIVRSVYAQGGLWWYQITLGGYSNAIEFPQ